MSRFKWILAGWEEATSKEYRQCFNEYGGSFSVHPDVLDYAHSIMLCNERYWVKTDSVGTPLGALCSWDDKSIANNPPKHRHECLPIIRDEIILPMSHDTTFLLPSKIKNLSAMHRGNSFNCQYVINARRTVCIAKKPDTTEMSSKFKKNQKRQLKKFVADGGEVKNIDELSTDDLIAIYCHLIKLRWGASPIDKDILGEFIGKMRGKVWGNVLIFNGEPCAFHFILKEDFPDWVSFEFVHTGLDPQLNNLSVGSVLTWVNLASASAYCNDAGKKMYYSFGAPTRDYKLLWCNTKLLGRTIYI